MRLAPDFLRCQFAFCPNLFPMKTPILVTGCILSIAASVWCMKQSPADRAAGTFSAAIPTFSPERKDISAGATASTENFQSSRDTTLAKPVAAAAPTHEPVHYAMTQAAPTSQNPAPNSVTPAATYMTSSLPRQNTPIPANKLPGQPATSSSSSSGTRGAIPNSSISNSADATSPGGNSAGAPLSKATTAAPGPDAGALELDPGVPAPAALMAAPQGNVSPTVAAAQQQLADSFVQNVNDALSQPAAGSSDDAASQIYYDSLTTANEQYRALYGDAAYNQNTMQATLEAQAGK